MAGGESSRAELWAVYSLHTQELVALSELLDELVGFSHKHGLVNGQAEALRRFEVDHQLEGCNSSTLAA
jgi:hypothetical protein